jgi:hypothetical protein
LPEFGLLLNLRRRIFCIDFFDFLGGETCPIVQPRARPLFSNVEAVLFKMSPPTNVTELQIFLGLINFYRKCLTVLPGILLPLTDVLKDSRPAE